MSQTRLPLGLEIKNGLRPQLTSALLEHIQQNDVIPAERQVFVNRTLRMESIRYIGFDLDWTLADYRRLPLEELCMSAHRSERCKWRIEKGREPD